MIRGTLSLLLVWVLVVQAVPLSAQDTEVLREAFRRTPLDTEIEVELESGETVLGQLAEVEDGFFALWISPDEETRRRLGLKAGSALRRKISYGDVNSVSGLKGQLDIAHTFAELQRMIKAGDRLHVTDSSGRSFEARLEECSCDALVLRVSIRSRHLFAELPSSGDLRLAEEDLRTVTFVRSSLSKGAFVGAAIGAGIGVLGTGLAQGMGCEYGMTCSHPADAAVPALIGGTIGALIGIRVAAGKRERRLLYQARPSSFQVNVSPILTKDRRGAALSLSW